MALPGAPSLSIAFGEGRRPDATVTHVTSPAFTGPLGLLLTLIEARQLGVDHVVIPDVFERRSDVIDQALQQLSR